MSIIGQTNEGPKWTESEFKRLFTPKERIALVMADGMWWSKEKIQRFAHADLETISQWLEEGKASGKVIQADTGEKSYRCPSSEIYRFYRRTGLSMTEQLIDKLFPPRIWSGLSEVEGFERAPLREVGIVNFRANPDDAKVLIESLKGLARVRDLGGGQFRAYGLSASLIKDTLIDTMKTHGIEKNGVTMRNKNMRRELVDFDDTFLKGMMGFYREFSRTLLKNRMDTIRIYIPDREDQDSQFSYWVISIIERYDETRSIPFSGYLQSAIRWWPYDLPGIYLGSELSKFQMFKSRAVKEIRKTSKPDPHEQITASEIAEKIGITMKEYLEFEEQRSNWLNARSAASLSWETGEERPSHSMNAVSESSASTDFDLANRISSSALKAGIVTGKFDDAFHLFTKVDSEGDSLDEMKHLDSEFVSEFGKSLGYGEDK